jgi:hypothetical protein
MLKAEDLRSGNQLIYWGEEKPLFCKIDWQDIKWCTEDPEGFNEVHSPIILTEPIMLFIRVQHRPDFSRPVFSMSPPGERQVENNFWSDELIDERKLHLSPSYDYEVNADHTRVKQERPKFWFCWICSHGTGSSWFMNIRDLRQSPLIHFHDLQNLYRSISGKELFINKQEVIPEYAQRDTKK